MQIEVTSPIFQTWLFTAFLVASLGLTLHRTKVKTFFSPILSTEIKGFAILSIVLAHVGYYLSKNTQFLFPLSVLAGVGVNLFFFLAGYGLTVSSLRTELTLKQFYVKRLKRLFMPLWWAITIIFFLDIVIHHQGYGFLTIIESYLGFYPKADLFLSFNAPLWYFTMIFFYYLIFPITFIKRWRYFAPLLIYLIFSAILALPLPVGSDLINLYKVHSLSFPLGMALAILASHFHFSEIKLPSLVRWPIVFILIAAAGYFALNSGVGHGVNIEQFYSLITVGAIILIGLLKTIRFGLFEILGAYSYEIYLFHWPILYRYDFLYTNMPAGLATFTYLGVFIALGWLFQKLQQQLA